MQVNELRSRIIDISHNESAPDTDLQTKALQWLNAAYHEIMNELSPFMPRYLEESVTLSTDADGAVALPTNVERIMRVIAPHTNSVLQETIQSTVWDIDPVLEQSGTPQRFYVQNSQLFIHPKAQTDIKVLYIKKINDLELNGTEESVLLPAHFHYALVWGALVWGTTYERGFSSQADLSLFQVKWEEAKRKIKLALISRPSAPLRTAPYKLV